MFSTFTQSSVCSRSYLLRSKTFTKLPFRHLQPFPRSTSVTPQALLACTYVLEKEDIRRDAEKLKRLRFKGIMSKLVQKLQQQGPIWTKMAVDYSKPRLLTFLQYAKVELTPPSPTDIPAIARGFSNVVRAASTAKYRHMEMREIWKNTLVTVEVLGWFFVGECIGKGKVIGYRV